MNANQENRHSSYFAIDGVFTSNEDAWKTNPAFSKSVTAFRGGFTTIQGLVQAMSVSTKGTTETKRAAREAMTEATLKLAGDLCGFASEAGNAELLAKVRLNPTDLRGLRDTEVAGFCQAIHDLGVEHLADLAEAQVTADDLTALQGLINAYGDTVGKPRQKRTEITSVVQQMDAAFNGTDKVLKEQLDPRMLKFKASKPDFFNSYFAARKIVDNPGGRPPKNGNNQPQPPQPN
jgi:hypothetical protein